MKLPFDKRENWGYMMMTRQGTSLLLKKFEQRPLELNWRAAQAALPYRFRKKKKRLKFDDSTQVSFNL